VAGMKRDAPRGRPSPPLQLAKTSGGTLLSSHPNCCVNPPQSVQPEFYVADVIRMVREHIKRLIRDDTGGEVLEYALIAGLIVVAAIAVIGSVGTKVLARWTSLNAGM
jgi:pilus assembly protein Flp/PilA